MNDKLALSFGGFLGRVDAILDSRGYNLQSQDVAHGEWRFDWYASFIIGCKPFEAVEDALMELRGRGIEPQELTICPNCDGEGRIAAYGCGDQAGGWAETCQDCKGSGRAQ